MFGIKKPSKWSWTPTQSKANPDLLRGLVLLDPFWRGASRDYIGPIIPSTGGDPTWANSAEGPALVMDSTDDYQRYLGAGGLIGDSSPWTIIIRARFTGTLGLTNFFNLNNNNGSRSICLTYWWSSGNGLLIHRGASGGERSCDLSVDDDVTLWHTYAFSWDGTNDSTAFTRVHVDGNRRDADDPANLTPAQADTLDLGQGFGGGYHSDHDISFVGLWNRSLSEREVWQLRNPFVLLERRVHETWTVPVVVGNILHLIKPEMRTYLRM